MKNLSLLVLAGVLAIPAISADAPAKAATAAAPKSTTASPAMSVTEAKITAPFVLKDGAISQPATTDAAGGGRAEFTFKVAVAGDYVVAGLVKAPDDDSNSFFLNIDAEPEDPLMIWDLEATNGFEERISNWRGTGEAGNDEFNPKTFKLKAGEHKLIIRGREPASLKSVSVRPAK
jgi:hypothetical protein